MSLNSWLKKLLPKQEQFYMLLKDQVRILKRMTKDLQTFNAADRTKEDFYKHCHEIEQQGDALVKEMAFALAKTFVTPLDREDLYHLSTLIEDALDACDEAARGFKLLPTNNEHSKISYFLGILDSSAEYLVKSIDALAAREFPTIFTNDEHIKSLEKKADNVYREEITALFMKDTDVKSLLVLKEVFEKLEEACNEMAHLSTFLTNLAVKHG